MCMPLGKADFGALAIALIQDLREMQRECC